MTAIELEQACNAVIGASTSESFDGRNDAKPLEQLPPPSSLTRPHSGAIPWLASGNRRDGFSLHVDPLSAILPMRPGLEHGGTCSGETMKDSPPRDGKHCQLAREKGDSHLCIADELCNSLFLFLRLASF
jgi:hypothetical protein